MFRYPVLQQSNSFFFIFLSLSLSKRSSVVLNWCAKTHILPSSHLQHLSRSQAREESPELCCTQDDAFQQGHPWSEASVESTGSAWQLGVRISPLSVKRGVVGNHFHTCDTSVFHHTRNARRRDILGVSSQGEFWLFRAAVDFFFAFLKLWDQDFLYESFSSLRASELLPFLTVLLNSWTPSLHQVWMTENPGSKGKYFSRETPGAAQAAQERMGKAVSTTAQGR